MLLSAGHSVLIEKINANFFFVSEIIDEFPGSKLVGQAYQPLFPGAIDKGDSDTAWTVVAADFVTTTDGTGIVHTAVMLSLIHI